MRFGYEENFHTKKKQKKLERCGCRGPKKEKKNTEN